MINDETKKKLRELKLGELINAYEIYSKNADWTELPFEQKFQMMADYLYQEKYNNSVKILMAKAKFRIPKAEVTSLVYEGRGIDRNLITELSTCQFISSNTNIVFQGFTGSGKTYLACALGRQPVSRDILQNTFVCRIFLSSMTKKKSRGGTQNGF